ncbi:hypothetical protein RchiOBHm_Chr0c13g0499641 [Rosa chinensis]|uniref:Uncharacterized protein n=1 Tax=Rosa chinensis TaxID=74649 RepID=A0A2P6SQR6_ROSCH|nr:hypothetical protein RchiOBHm_Chr0c13g0499641 [Rosa chinensis]
MFQLVEVERKGCFVLRSTPRVSRSNERELIEDKAWVSKVNQHPETHGFGKHPETHD